MVRWRVGLSSLAPQQAVDFLCVADPRIFRKQPVKFDNVLPGLIGGKIIGVPVYDPNIQNYSVFQLLFL